MIHQIGQIMLYVDNQDESMEFWTNQLGFHVMSEEDNGQGLRWIEIAPTKEAGTSIVLHDKQAIAAMQPELHLHTPSIMFYSDDIDQLYEEYIGKNITVGDKVNMPAGKVFNFADNEGNYFAVMGKK